MPARISAVVAVLLFGCVLADAAPRVAQPGSVRLPYMVNDNSGNQWVIYQQGMLRMQGNMPLYSQAAMLTVNGNGMSHNNNQASVDPKTGEVLVEGTVGNIRVTRRILVNKQDGYVRYIDVFKNPGAAEMQMSVQINSNFNYGVQSSQDIGDPKSKDRTMAWAAHLHAGRAVYEMYAGKGSKLAPQINGQPDNNVCQATLNLTLPANGQAAILHLHGSSANTETASQFVQQIKENQMLADLPLDIRKIIVNVVGSQTIGDREVLRGDLFDVIELRGGDVLNGTINEPTYKLQTFYGQVELQADRVVGLINVGQFKPRQLLVTVDGEVFGGHLAKDALAVQLSSGQTTSVPLSQISRAGYRKRSGEPEEWNFNRPMIRLRTGERMLVAMPEKPYEVMTRYGLLQLAPGAIASITLQSEDHGVHSIELTDGSRFAGLVNLTQFDLQLVGTTARQDVSFPAAAVLRLQLAEAAEGGDDDPRLELTNQDVMVGTLAGQLTLDTLFDAITIDASELRGLAHSVDAGLDVQATLWDRTSLSGQLREPQITCALASGISLNIPVALVDRYTNPLPRPSPMVIDRIKAIVKDLAADDWKQREQAESQLVSMGPVVTSVIRELLPSQPPEAQQRIESILKQLEKAPDPAAAAAAPAAEEH